jgi:hypothetical protein
MIWYIIAFAAGWYVRELYAVRKINNMLKEMDLEEKAEPKVKELKVNIEKHNGNFYLYKQVDDQFIAQGATKSEVIELLKKSYPATNIVADPDNIKEVDFK